MKILAVISQKGGAGKTTLATALAVAAQQDGREVALLDLDPQASACFWGDRRKANNGGIEAPPVRDVNWNRLRFALEQIGGAGKATGLIVIDCPPQQRDIAQVVHQHGVLARSDRPSRDRRNNPHSAAAGQGRACCPVGLPHFRAGD